jgi:spermidine synthase
MTGILWLCYAVSGAAALALEMLWMRSASLVFGTTPQTTAMVLATYFAGMTLGAAAGGLHLAARPIRRYALLELGTAVGALWSNLVFRILAESAEPSVSGAVGIGLAILPAILCQGATLPAIGQALIARGTLAPRGASLYAVNTLGGAVGLAACGFGLPVAIGVRATYLTAAGASAVAGLLALAVSRRESRRRIVTPPPSDAAPSAISTSSVARLCAVAAIAGALGLGLEVLWTRLFAQVLHNSVYSFSAVALVFVLALAIGAAIAPTLLRRAAPETVAAGALATAAAATLGGFWIFVRWTDGLAYLGMRTGLPEYVGRILLVAAASAGPAALASGIVLPALWSAWGDRQGPARPLGALGAANALGAVAGALAVGLLVAPGIGIRAGILLAALAYVAAGQLLVAGRLVRSALAGILLLAAIADPMHAPLVHVRSPSESVREIREGAAGITSVVESDDDLQLRLDNYYVLGGSAAATNERRLGLVPLLLHPAPRTVAFVGLATGISASAAAALEIPDVRVVELVPEVAEAARTHFAPWNGSILERPNVHLAIDDGRRWLRTAHERFDVIVSDLFIPWHAGTSGLYAREMYETVATRLAPGGLFCQWLPLYQLTREEFDVVVRTFLDVFPEAQLWRADFYPDRPVVGLVGRLAPDQLDLERVGSRLAELPEWSRDPFLASPRALAMLYAGDLRSAAADFADAPLNTDDRPRIEFLAPRLTRMSAAGDKDWFTGEALASFYDRLTASAPATEPILPATDETHAAETAGPVLYRYALAATRHDPQAAALADEVRRLAPDVVAASERASDDLAERRRDLADLRASQDAVRRDLESMQRRLDALGAGSRGATR